MPGGYKGVAGWNRAASGGQEKTSEWECLWRTYKSDLREKESAFNVGHSLFWFSQRDLSFERSIFHTLTVGMEVGRKQQLVGEGRWEWERYRKPNSLSWRQHIACRQPWMEGDSDGGLASPVAQMVKNPPAVWETWVPPQSWKITWTTIVASQREWSRNELRRNGEERDGHEICQRGRICRGSCWLGFLSGSVGKESVHNAGDPADEGLIPGSGRSSKKEMATHSSVLAWEIPWTEEPGGLQAMGSQGVCDSWATEC